MIQDQLLTVADAKALPNATTEVSPSSIDIRALDFDGTTLNASPDIAAGYRVRFAISFPSAPLATATSLRFEAILTTAAALTGNIITIGDTGVITLADNDGSEPWILDITEFLDGEAVVGGNHNYLGIRVTAAGNASGETYTASLVLDAPTPQRHYKSKFTV